jgi:hypothetical protein
VTLCGYRMSDTSPRRRISVYPIIRLYCACASSAQLTLGGAAPSVLHEGWPDAAPQTVTVPRSPSQAVCTPHGRLLPVVLGAVSPCALDGIHRLHWARRLLHPRRSCRRVLTLLWGGERACEDERAEERPVQGGGAGSLCRRPIQLLTETTLVHTTSALKDLPLPPFETLRAL